MYIVRGRVPIDGTLHVNSAIISSINIPIRQVCNSSCLEIWQCLIIRKRMYQLVVGQVLYRHDLQCSQSLPGK